VIFFAFLYQKSVTIRHKPRGKIQRNRSKSDSQNRTAPNRTEPCRDRQFGNSSSFSVCGNFCRAAPTRTA
jgi:hypothetical protein